MDNSKQDQGVASEGSAGVSTTRELRMFRTESYTGADGERRVQWDYRDSNGTLHSGIAPSERAAREEAERRSGERIMADQYERPDQTRPLHEADGTGARGREALLLLAELNWEMDRRACPNWLLEYRDRIRKLGGLPCREHA